MASTTISRPIANIQNNILTLDRRSIQISNISQMSVQRKDGKRAILAGIILIVLAIVSFSVAGIMGSNYYGDAAAGPIVLGVLLLAGAVGLFIWYAQRGHFLLLEMNSGAYFWISSRNQQEESFLLQAKQQLCACANKNMTGVSIDFSQCTIMNSNVLSNQATVG